MTLLHEIDDYVFEGDSAKVRELVERALNEGVPAEEILNGALIPAMDRMGTEFEAGLMFLPDMLRSARAMGQAMVVLDPHFRGAGVPFLGKVVLGSVAGDIHDIGKNLVAMMFGGAGLEVIDLGTDVAPQEFVAAVAKHHPDIVAMSALLTTTMPMMKKTIEALQAAGLRQGVRVIVGGAPITETYAADIGADWYARDAAAGARLCRNWMLTAKPAAAG